jgi:hypothetical protein
MEYPDERTPNNVITSDTDNATTIQPKEAPPGKRDKFRRFRAYNTNMWNGPRRENTESFRRQDDLHRYDSISSSLDLTPHQKDRGRNILDSFDPHTFGQSIDHIIFGICVVVANADVDGTRYWPTRVSESEPSCVFEEVAAEIGFGWKEQMSIIKKVQSRVDV